MAATNVDRASDSKGDKLGAHYKATNRQRDGETERRRDRWIVKLLASLVGVGVKAAASEAAAMPVAAAAAVVVTAENECLIN